jgi:predicted kinase
MATLLLINGPPGVGKSTLAASYLRGHPDARCVEIDGLRMQMDGWQTDDSTRLTARDLALAAIEESLEEGRDVLVPQFLGRTEFVDQLALAASRLGARFIHVVLSARSHVVVDRFAQRRAGLAALGAHHPEGEVDDLDDTVSVAQAQMAALIATHPTEVLDAEADDLVARLNELLSR